MNEKEQVAHFALCLDNAGYEVSLEIGKLYQVQPDSEAEARGYLRIVDESGEDYAYSATRFHLISLPQHIEEALLTAAHG